MLRDLSQIRGRVLREDHPAGYVFTETDFFPKGTRPGVAGGIPPGCRGLAVDARKIVGLDKLRQGDRFDIQVTLPLDAGTSESSAPALIKLSRTRLLTSRKSAYSQSV